MKTPELLTELRALSTDDLQSRGRDLEERVFRLRLQSSMGQGEAGHKIRPLRKELARVQTVLREKSQKSEVKGQK